MCGFHLSLRCSRQLALFRARPRFGKVAVASTDPRKYRRRGFAHAWARPRATGFRQARSAVQCSAVERQQATGPTARQATAGQTGQTGEQPALALCPSGASSRLGGACGGLSALFGALRQLFRFSPEHQGPPAAKPRVCAISAISQSFATCAKPTPPAAPPVVRRPAVHPRPSRSHAVTTHARRAC
jgi:hypothetical protein